MRIWALVLLFTVSSSSLAVGQVLRSPGASKRPSSNFGWQNRQEEAIEEKEKFLDVLRDLSDEEWKQTALAQMAFGSAEGEISFSGAYRIGAATADRKAVTREVQGSSADPRAWIVAFGNKMPRILTLTLTDGARTRVRCEVGELLEAGEGYVGVFQTGYEILCMARPSRSG